MCGCVVSLQVLKTAFVHLFFFTLNWTFILFNNINYTINWQKCELLPLSEDPEFHSSLPVKVTD